MKLSFAGYGNAEPARVVWSLCTTLALSLLVVMLLHGLAWDDSGRLDANAPMTEPLLETVPADLPDFAGLRDVQDRKRRFFAFLRPIVEQENARIRNCRDELARLLNRVRTGQELRDEEMAWLRGLAHEFRIDPELLETSEGLKRLRARVDIVPTDLVLVQAATESGWGTSRFAREGNNLFGQWQYGGDGGMVPERRSDGATHRVARFDSVNDSVRSYLRNLNTNPAYGTLRVLRQAQRETETFPDSAELAGGLLAYSQRREAYVTEIRAMLRINRSLLVEQN